MPKPRSRFLILAASATLACLLTQTPAHAVTWLGFFHHHRTAGPPDLHLDRTARQWRRPTHAVAGHSSGYFSVHPGTGNHHRQPGRHGPARPV